jgi:hypothetical protein
MSVLMCVCVCVCVCSSPSVDSMRQAANGSTGGGGVARRGAGQQQQQQAKSRRLSSQSNDDNVIRQTYLAGGYGRPRDDDSSIARQSRPLYRTSPQQPYNQQTLPALGSASAPTVQGAVTHAAANADGTVVLTSDQQLMSDIDNSCRGGTIAQDSSTVPASVDSELTATHRGKQLENGGENFTANFSVSNGHKHLQQHEQQVNGNWQQHEHHANNGSHPQINGLQQQQQIIEHGVGHTKGLLLTTSDGGLRSSSLQSSLADLEQQKKALVTSGGEQRNNSSSSVHSTNTPASGTGVGRSTGVTPATLTSTASTDALVSSHGAHGITGVNSSSSSSNDMLASGRETTFRPCTPMTLHSRDSARDTRRSGQQQLKQPVYVGDVKVTSRNADQALRVMAQTPSLAAAMFASGASRFADDLITSSPVCMAAFHAQHRSRPPTSARPSSSLGMHSARQMSATAMTPPHDISFSLLAGRWGLPLLVKQL